MLVVGADLGLMRLSIMCGRVLLRFGWYSGLVDCDLGLVGL